MKKTTIVIFSFFFFLGAFAQYGNEWIDYDKTYYKITLAEDKLYRIPFSTLLENNVPTDNASNLKLIYKGEEIPMFATTNDALMAGDYIEFYGKKNDGTFDTQLFEEPDWQITNRKSSFTDTAAYFLVYDDSSPALRYGNLTNDLSNTPQPKEFFEHTSHRILNQAFFDGKPTTTALGGLNSYSSNFGQSEGFLSTIINTEQNIDFTVLTPGVYDNGGDATIEVKMIGRSNDLYYAAGDHHVRLSFNNVLFVDNYYEGYNTEVYSFNTQASNMQTFNVLNVETVGDVYNPDFSNSSIDRNSVGYIFTTYPRSFDLENISILDFDLNNDENHYLEFENFDGGTNPVLYDRTNNLRMIPILENGVYKVFLPQIQNGAAKRNLILASTTTANVLTQVNILTQRQFTNYSDPAIAADYIILTHPRLMENFNGESQVERYRAYRASEAGGSYTPLVVDVNELYDQFAYGIEQTPLAIRFFVNYIVDQHAAGNWNIKPELLFLLGKSIRYNSCTNNPTNFNDNLVPTYGTNGSDILLSARDITTFQYQLGTGRVSAKTSEEVSRYLDKITEYEQVLNTNHPCTVEDRQWLKEVLHIGAGNFSEEEEFYNSLLDGYKEIIEMGQFGGKVVASVSTGDNAVTIAPVEEYINNGLNHITYVGHSNGQFWQYGLEAPENYDNEGKSLFVISSACFVGDVHKPFSNNENNIIMAERFTLAEKGSVGFMAAVKFGFPAFLDNFTSELHENFTNELYGEPFVLSMRNTTDVIFNGDSEFIIGDQLTSEEMVFCGDPAVELYHFDRPEYILTEGNIVFDPPFIPAGIDSVELSVKVFNMGKAVEDSMDISIQQTFPDGFIGPATLVRVPSPVYEETYTVSIPVSNTEHPQPVGLNQFKIHIDGENQIVEDCEDNNVIIKTQLIQAPSAYPIAPCDFAIVGEIDFALKAVTAVPILENQTYLFEIDTTALFDSPLLKEGAVESIGGIIEWNPSLVLQNNTTYYWRVSVLPETGQNNTWESSSFTYISGSGDNNDNGWNQSHYYQLASNDFENCLIEESSRNFVFSNEEMKTIGCTNTQINNFSDFNMIQYEIDSSLLAQGSCLFEAGLSGIDCRGGVHIVAIDPIEFEAMISYQIEAGANPDINGNCDELGQFGNIHCTQTSKPYFQFHIETQDDVDNLMTLLDSIPNGYFVLAYNINTHNLTNNPNADLTPVHNFFNEMGINDFNTIAADETFIAFGRKNQADYGKKQLLTTTNPDEILELNVNIDLNTLEGNFTTQKIGPALSWDRLEWNDEPLFAGEINDEFAINVYGIDENNQTQILLNTAGETDWDLSNINATQYPQLMLVAEIGDSVNATAPQLQDWQVYYEQVPEFVFNGKEGFTFYDDTLRLGEMGIFEIAVTNISSALSDSLVVSFTTINSQNISNTEYVKYPPIVGNETNLIAYDFSTAGLLGDNYLQVMLNPDKGQIEKQASNNMMILPFHVVGNEINTDLDIAFDGVHIMNGDIVSAEPEITIQLSDENLFVPLNESAIEVSLIYPDGQEVLLDLTGDNSTVVVPTTAEAAQGNNELSVAIRTEFLQNGTHQLKVIAQDLSENGGTKEYLVSFEIIREAMITNVLNYPNPFTTSTRFLFTLTGTEIPDNLKIQVMTVSGTVVREILKEELGPIRIGKNITEFAWDGTDMFGNELANGVYFYRVVAQQNGEDLELFTNSESGRFNMSSTNKMDATFGKYGIGKMYKMR